MLTRMSDSPKHDSRTNTFVQDGGVLAKLPRARPQRSTRRRAAARGRSLATPRASSGGGSRTTRHAAARKGSVLRPAPVPRQGFESGGGERLSGSIQPPGAVELAESAAEIVGELARAGLSAGEGLLKRALSRLRLP
jgi:hypothetical protein